VNSADRQLYLKNAYRVILTRARQGMVIYVPTGSDADQTRLPSFYEGIFSYLIKCGLVAVDTVK
jgi:capsule polysaccharide modification protein KpsS